MNQRRSTHKATYKELNQALDNFSTEYSRKDAYDKKIICIRKTLRTEAHQLRIMAATFSIVGLVLMNFLCAINGSVANLFETVAIALGNTPTNGQCHLVSWATCILGIILGIGCNAIGIMLRASSCALIDAAKNLSKE